MAEAWVSPIVVGFDGSPDSVHALDWALAEAGLRDAQVTICHVGSRPVGDAGDARQATVRRMLAEGRRYAAEQAPNVHVRAELLSGNPAEVLAQVADEAALLVVGARGVGGLYDRLLGSVSAQVARHARCPVVVVRDGAVRGEGNGAHGGRIAVGIDGEADCGTTLAFAFQEAARREGTVYAVHAFDEAALQTVEFLDESELRRLRQAAEDSFGTLLAPQADKYRDVAISFKLIQGGPGPALIEASADADVLVLGSHDHGRLATAVLGSTSHTVLHHAACPVAVVRGER